MAVNPNLMSSANQPLYSPAGGYGTKVGNQYFVQTPTGGTWSNTPASQAGGGVVKGVYNDPAANTGGGGQQNVDYYTNELGQRVEIDKNKAADDAQRREAEMRGQIDSYESRLLGLRPGLESDRDQQLSSIASQYGMLGTNLAGQRDASLQKLGEQETYVQGQGARSVEDLQRNLSSVIRGTQMQMGNRGVDSDSVNTMLPYAYSKVGAPEFRKIDDQTRGQVFEIGQKRTDVDTQYDQMNTEIEMDKQAKEQDVRGRYASMLQAINTQYAQVPTMRAQLASNLLEKAQSELSQIEAESRQYKYNLQSQIDARQIEYGKMPSQLAGAGQFDPKGINYNQVGMNGMAGAGQSGDYDYYNQLATARRKQYLG